jgi:cytochrome c oxidase subunit 4
MTREDWHTIRHHMRTPVLSFVALLLLLGVNVLLGVYAPFRFRNVWIVEAGVALTMVLIVLLVSMELLKEPPVIRLFSGVGFYWLLILFSLTLLDYLTR